MCMQNVHCKIKIIIVYNIEVVNPQCSVRIYIDIHARQFSNI